MSGFQPLGGWFAVYLGLQPTLNMWAGLRPSRDVRSSRIFAPCFTLTDLGRTREDRSAGSSAKLYVGGWFGPRSRWLGGITEILFAYGSG